MMPIGARIATHVLHVVEPSAAPEVPPEVSPWQREMDACTFQALMSSVARLGQGPQGGRGRMTGLWSDPCNARSVRHSLSMLRELAQEQLSLALVAHRHAVVQWVLRHCEAGQDTVSGLSADTLAFAGSVRHGLALDSLGAWLVCAPLSPADLGRLEDWLDHTHTGRVLAAPGWQGLLRPCWHEGTVQWCLQARDELMVQAEGHLHGLEALDISAVCSAAIVRGEGRCTDTRWRSSLSPEAARHAMATVMKMEFLAAMAMGLGVQDRESAWTGEPAAWSERCSGVMASHEGHAWLERWSRPLNDLSLAGLAAERQAFSDALVLAGQQLIDGLGGAGLVGDEGLEALVRAQHLLRWMAGGVSALPGLMSGLGRRAE